MAAGKQKPPKSDGLRDAALKANWENCSPEWHEAFPTPNKNYALWTGQLRKGLGLISPEAKRDFLEMYQRGENMMAIANSMRIPVRMAYHLARVNDDTDENTNGMKVGERLDRLETRFVKELERRTQTPADRRKLSMEEITTGLKAIRDHRAVDIQRSNAGEGGGTAVSVHVGGDWMTEDKVQ